MKIEKLLADCENEIPVTRRLIRSLTVRAEMFLTILKLDGLPPTVRYGLNRRFELAERELTAAEDRLVELNGQIEAYKEVLAMVNAEALPLSNCANPAAE